MWSVEWEMAVDCYERVTTSVSRGVLLAWGVVVFND